MTEPTWEPAGRSMSWRAGLLWLLAEILAAAAVVAGSYVVAGALGLAAVTAEGTAGATGAEILPFLVHPIALVAILVAERARLRAWLRPRGRDLSLGVVLGVLLVTSGALYAATARALGFDVPDVGADLRTRAPSAILLLWGAGIVPLVEEAWFRGRLVEALDARLGRAWAAAITSALFAIVHGIPVLFPAYVGFALVLLAARRRTGGLVAPVVAHAVNNLAGLFPWGI